MFVRFFTGLSTGIDRNVAEEIDNSFINYRKKCSDILHYQYNENLRCQENS